MIILGLLLLAVALVAAVELIVANDDAKIAVDMWRWSWTVDAFWLAVAGAAILAVALLGLWMLKAGSRRERRLRRERRELAKENRQLSERAEVAEATDSGPVRDDAPDVYDAPRQGYPPPAETTTAPPPPAAPPARTEYGATPGETYSGEPVEGRHLDR